MTNTDSYTCSNLVYYIKLNLRNYILNKKVDIKTIAAKIDRSVPSIYRYLNTSNDDLPNIETLEQIVNCFNISLDDFLAESMALSEKRKKVESKKVEK